MSNSAASNSQEALVRYSERMNRLMDDKEAAMEAIKDLKIELKSAGFDVSAFTRNIKWARKNEAFEREKAIRDAEEIYGPHMGVKF